ncbi:MAG: AI-2E family transporter [Niabella sp.]
MKVHKISDNIIRQLFLIVLISVLGITILFHLSYFIPGALGAITLYILYRNIFFRLTEKRGWRKVWASSLLMVITVAAMAVPMWLVVKIMIPQVNSVLENRMLIVEKFNSVKAFMQSKPVLNQISISQDQLMSYLQTISSYLPAIFNSVAEVFVNIATALFILYFMLMNARNMERRINLFMPFSDDNKQNIWDETNMMVRSNAIGIPILAFCQGIVAVIGYIIFGVSNPFLWGMLTGAASIVPAVGTMVVWVPICIVQFATGSMGNGIGLTIYCLLAVGGIDNVLRFTILKRIGDVHPLVTVFGVLLGLSLFGMMGLIFGPLLLSYFTLLIKVYRTEFGKKQELLLAQTEVTEVQKE